MSRRFRRAAVPSDPLEMPQETHETRQLRAFLANSRAAIIVLSEEGGLMEHTLDQPRVLIGRGPGVDLAVDEPSLERVHAVLEFDGGGYRLREPAVDGSVDAHDDESRALECELKDGDRFRLGLVTFAYVCDPRKGPLF